MTEYPVERLHQDEKERLFEMFCAFSMCCKGELDTWWVRRLKSVPGAWRDYRLVTKKLEHLISEVTMTIPVDRLVKIRNQLNTAKYNITFGVQADSHGTKLSDDELIETEHLDALCRAAWDSGCRLCFGKDCNTCPVGRTLDSCISGRQHSERWSDKDVGGILDAPRS